MTRGELKCIYESFAGFRGKRVYISCFMDDGAGNDMIDACSSTSLSAVQDGGNSSVRWCGRQL